MIPEIMPYNNYTGDGAATQFDFDFYIEDGSQLVVQHTAADGTITTLTQDTDYSIHEVGNKNGSYITFPLPASSYSVLASDEAISLQLTLPIEQESEYGTSSELDLESLEYSLDYLTRIAQIQSRQLERAIKVQEASDIDTDELSVDLTIVAGIKDEIANVAGNKTNINTVSGNTTNINTVAGSIANVNAVGADIANVCREAAFMPMRLHWEKNKDISKLEDIVNKTGFQENLDADIKMKDFVQAMKNIKKSVGKEDLKEYDNWTKEFKSV